jgi:hypothetical protein
MVWILWPLVILTLFDGLLNLPGGIGKNFLGHYLEAVPGARPELGASVSLEWTMGILSAAIVLVSLLLAYILYVRRLAPEPLRQGFHEFLLSGLYLDRLYQVIFVGPYQRMAEFMKGRVEEQGIDGGIVTAAIAFFNRFWDTANFLWLKVEERGIDRGIVTMAVALFNRFWDMANFLWLNVDDRTLDGSYTKGATGFLTLSRGFGYWTTGRLSTYVKMLLLGLTAFLVVLVWGWYD